jgi:hypothetical protein
MHTNTDVRQREKETLEQMLLEGRSGRGIEIGSKEWKESRKELADWCAYPNKYNHRYEAWRVTRD